MDKKYLDYTGLQKLLDKFNNVFLKKDSLATPEYNGVMSAEDKKKLDSVFIDNNDHEYVDLGLPSGNLWAKYNVGASSETEPGLYFAWGDVNGYTKEQVLAGESTFRTDYFEGYKYSNNGDFLTHPNLTKYCCEGDHGYQGFVDNKIKLDLEDDAARVHMGGLWRTPMIEDARELLDNTTYEYTTNYNNTGKAGVVLTSKINGNKMFIVMQEIAKEDGLTTLEWVYLWLGELALDNPYKSAMATNITYLKDNSEPWFPDGTSRNYGIAVRGVLSPGKYLRKKDAEENYYTREEVDDKLTPVESKLEGVTKAADDSKVIKEIRTYNGDVVARPINNRIYISGNGDIRAASSFVGDNYIDLNVNPYGNIATKGDLETKANDEEVIKIIGVSNGRVNPSNGQIAIVGQNGINIYKEESDIIYIKSDTDFLATKEDLETKADDSKVIKRIWLEANGGSWDIDEPENGSIGFIFKNGFKFIPKESDSNCVTIDINTDYLATKESVDNLVGTIDTFWDAYVKEYLTLEGTFYSDTSSDWNVTIGGKNYKSNTKTFKFILDAPLVLTSTMFTDKYTRLLLPRCTVSSSMNNIFKDMSHLRVLDISKVDWSNATTMNYAFSNFPKYSKIIGLESLSTTHNCTSFNYNGILKYNPDAYFDTSKIAKFDGNTYNFQTDEEVQLGKFDLSGVTEMHYLYDNHPNVDFTGTNLRPTNLEQFLRRHKGKLNGINDIDTSKCTNMSSMFMESDIDFDYSEFTWNTSKVKNFTQMCNNANFTHNNNHLDLSWIDLSSAQSIQQMVWDCKNLQSLNAGMKNMGPHITNTKGFIVYSNNLTDLELGSNFDMSGSYDMVLNNYFDYEDFNANNLTNVTGVLKYSTIFPKLILSRASKLTRESLLVFINGLPESSTEKILQLHADAFARLQEEDIAIATSKGWTITT